MATRDTPFMVLIFLSLTPLLPPRAGTTTKILFPLSISWLPFSPGEEYRSLHRLQVSDQSAQKKTLLQHERMDIRFPLLIFYRIPHHRPQAPHRFSAFLMPLYAGESRAFHADSQISHKNSPSTF